MAKYMTLGQLKTQLDTMFRSLKTYLDDTLTEPVKSLAQQAKVLADEVVRRANAGEFKGEPGRDGAAGPQGPPGSDAEVTAENITAALGYTPADTDDIPDLSPYRTAAAQDVIDLTKQDTITDLATIRSGASAGATALQPPPIKTTMDAVAAAGAKYFLGEQTAVSITMPTDAALGQEISVVFYSGSTAATLTINGTTIGDVPVPTANQRIELSMLWDGSYWAIVSNVMGVPT